MININFENNIAPIQITGYFRTQVDNGFHEIWQIQALVPFSINQMKEYCKCQIIKKDIPDSETWHEQIKKGNQHQNDWCYYTNGFYKIEDKGNSIFEFTHVIPDMRPEAWQSDENRHQT